MKVINNVIPKKYQDQIEKMMLSLEFDWHFLDDVTYAPNEENDDPKRVEFPDAKGSQDLLICFIINLMVWT
ncbi:MAG: hypothetical protein CM15mV13_0420 [uncultured marine virus]|nr:MAG: hypothetical protein CM15mV13_0420 [uncultured marine virus]